MSERPADRLKRGEMTPGDRALLDQAYAEARDDLDRLLEWAGKLAGSETEETLVASRITLALDEESSWDRLMLVTTLGVALMRLLRVRDGVR